MLVRDYTIYPGSKRLILMTFFHEKNLQHTATTAWHWKRLEAWCGLEALTICRSSSKFHSEYLLITQLVLTQQKKRYLLRIAHTKSPSKTARRGCLFALCNIFMLGIGDFNLIVEPRHVNPSKNFHVFGFSMQLTLMGKQSEIQKSIETTAVKQSQRESSQWWVWHYDCSL